VREGRRREGGEGVRAVVAWGAVNSDEDADHGEGGIAVICDFQRSMAKRKVNLKGPLRSINIARH